MMAAQGHAPLCLSPYIEANRTAYYTALKVAQQRHPWHEIIGFIAEAISATVGEPLATRVALREPNMVWRSRRKLRAGSSALRALDVLPHYPILTTARLASVLQVSTPQANQAIAQLIEAGILHERTGYRRNRLFAATEALSVINSPFGEEPVLPSPIG